MSFLMNMSETDTNDYVKCVVTTPDYSQISCELSLKMNSFLD
jgi:hypothetical protein